ncbi:MAG: hypothetical protein ABIM40_00775 [Pseudomonadota bacterium]
MPTNYNIQAEIIDIRTDTPQAVDVLLVDTNVWFWMTYSKAGHTAQAHQMINYPKYLSMAISANAQLLRSGLSFAELAHLIEKTEREIYEGVNGPIQAKEYRHTLSSERAGVVSEVQSSWGQVKSMAASLDCPVTDLTTDSAATRFQEQLVDGHDLFILESMAREGVIQILTDDADFSTIPGIQVFTANRNVINTAQTVGKLSQRRVTRATGRGCVPGATHSPGG